MRASIVEGGEVATVATATPQLSHQRPRGRGVGEHVVLAGRDVRQEVRRFEHGFDDHDHGCMEAHRSARRNAIRMRFALGGA